MFFSSGGSTLCMGPSPSYPGGICPLIIQSSPQYRPSVDDLPPIPLLILKSRVCFFLVIHDSLNRRFPNAAVISPVLRAAVLGGSTVTRRLNSTCRCELKGLKNLLYTSPRYSLSSIPIFWNVDPTSSRVWPIAISPSSIPIGRWCDKTIFGMKCICLPHLEGKALLVHTELPNGVRAYLQTSWWTLVSQSRTDVCPLLTLFLWG